MIKMVMENFRIPPYAKLIYAYLYTFADDNHEVIIEQKRIYKDLDISIDTLQKYLTILKEMDLIRTIKRRNDRGNFARNIYQLRGGKDD